MTHLSKEYKIDHSLVVDEEDLDFLINYLKDDNSSIEYIEAYLVDGTKYLPENYDELKSYENRESKKITGLGIKGKSKGVDYNIRLGESNYSFEKNLIRYSSNEMDSYTNFENEVISRIKEMKPIHSFVHKMNMTFVFPIGLFVLAMIITLSNLIIRLINDQPVQESKSTLSDAEWTVVTYVIYIGLFLIGFIVEKLKLKLFPQIFFCIGKQKKILKRIQFWRSFILITVIVGIIIELMF